MKETVCAIVLAAGAGKRMGAGKPKQYITLGDKPVMVHCLETFEKSDVDNVVLVVAPGEIDYCRRQIVETYHLKKVTAIVEGGKERYDSVYRGLLAAESDYVMIHDAARPFLRGETVAMLIKEVKESQACVLGVPVKDTIKMTEEDNTVKKTLQRDLLWAVQTPQCFSYRLLRDAYEKLFATTQCNVTDDAMVVETMTQAKIKMILGDYDNIKITTRDDLILGERILEKSAKNV